MTDDVEDLKRRLRASLLPKDSDPCECGHQRSLHHAGAACFADDDCQCTEFEGATEVILPRPS